MDSFILYDGPSAINGEPVVAVAVGLGRPSSNQKTGPMAQIYILRSDVHPMEAVNTGADAAICGDCVHRGRIETDPTTGLRKNKGRSCYVTLLHAPSVIYRSYKAGKYYPLTPALARTSLRGRKVRLGAYGDPGAIPEAVLQTALMRVPEMTGYTHLWRRFPYLASFCMASCDTEDDRIAAKALGFRTFRVRTQGEPLMTGEGHCPASSEMGKATRCDACLLCGGHRTNAKADITLLAHGVGAKHLALTLTHRSVP